MRCFLKNNEDFCDLFCYACDCYVLRSCPLFGYMAPFKVIQLNFMREGILFDSFEVKGAWKEFIAIDGGAIKDLNFLEYKGETQN